MIIQCGIFALMKRIYLLILLVSLWTMPVAWAQKKAKALDALTPAQSEELMTEAMRHYVQEEYDEAILIWEHLIQEVPKEASIFYYLAKSYLAQDKKNLAYQNAKEAHALSPFSLDYGLFYVDLALDLRNHVEALAVLKKLLAFDESQPEVNIRLAQAYLWTDQGEEALAALQKADAFIGDYPEIIRTKQFIYLKKKDVSSAFREGEHLLEIIPEESLFSWDQMELLWDLVHGAEFKKLFEQGLNRFPDQGQIQLLQAKLFIEGKNLDSTCVKIRQGAVDARVSTELLGQLALLAMELVKSKEDWARAHELVLDLRHIYPEEPRFVALEGDLWISISKFQEAQTSYLQAARMGNPKFEVWARIVQLDFELNQLDSAIVHCDEALYVFPSEGFLLFQKGFAQYLQTKTAEAIGSFEKAIPLLKDSNGWFIQLYGLLGDAYHAKTRFAESDACFEKVLAVNPEEEHVLNNYSYYLSLRKDQLDKAARMSKRLVDKFPDNGTYLDTYAWVLFQQKDFEGALKFMERALKDEKQNSSTVWEHYGDALSQNNRIEDAIKAWKMAKTMEGAREILDKKIKMKRFIEN
jgi:tetratricopeptide (TPR) repeat protein